MSSKTDIWMPLYIGDYLADTSHLGALESGAYLHLLMHSWRTGALPADTEQLRRIAKVDPDAWSNAWGTIQAFFKFDASNAPHQERLERERTGWAERKVKAAARAKKAARGRWNDAPSNAQAMLDECPSPTTSSSTTPLTPLKGVLRKREAQKLATASVGMAPPRTPEQIAADEAYFEAKRAKPP